MGFVSSLSRPQGGFFSEDMIHAVPSKSNCVSLSARGFSARGYFEDRHRQLAVFSFNIVAKSRQHSSALHESSISSFARHALAASEEGPTPVEVERP
jgi:hypothetical protein